MTERPNPDTLLQRVKAAEAQQQRGTLKVFFGAAAGVGKTYAMLEAGHQRRADGVDVVAGYIISNPTGGPKPQPFWMDWSSYRR